MSQVTIEYVRRVMGRRVGEVETVERTEFVNALIEKNRVKILDAPEDVAPEVTVIPEGPIALVKPTPKPGRIGESRRKIADEA